MICIVTFFITASLQQMDCQITLPLASALSSAPKARVVAKAHVAPKAHMAVVPAPKARSPEVLLADTSIQRQQGSVLDVVFSKSLPLVQPHSPKAQMQPANWDGRDLFYHLLDIADCGSSLHAEGHEFTIAVQRFPKNGEFHF